MPAGLMTQQSTACSAAAASGRLQGAARSLPRRHALSGAAVGRPAPAGLGRGLSSASRAQGRRAGAVRVQAAATPGVPGANSASEGPFDWMTDEWKEADRKNLRTVFDFDAWKRHRSSSRYWRHLGHLPNSRILKWVAGPLSYVTAVAIGVCAYHTAAEAGIVPEVLPELAKGAAAPFGLTSFALSTLLVLRTNTSYQRWDEARKMWGLIVNRSRDVARQALGYIPASQPELQDMFCRWLVAYCRSLMCHLRPGEDLRAELEGKLKPEELEALLSSAHRPNYTCQVLTAVIKRAQLPGDDIDNRDSFANVKASAAFRMDENLTQFADVTGGCERILRTPVPLMYTRHNSRFLMIWLSLLPFTLWDTCHWATVPVTALVAFLLLGIKEVGVAIEEPFTILPLEVICNTIEGNVWELHRMHSANGVEQQHAAGNAVVTAEALVDIMAPQTIGGLALNGAGSAAYVNGNGNGAYTNGAANGNGAESGTIKVPPEELIRAAQGLRQRVSSSLRQ
jgi:predicted membrane chloride channel (bestrophin family)